MSSQSSALLQQTNLNRKADLSNYSFVNIWFYPEIEWKGRISKPVLAQGVPETLELFTLTSLIEEEHLDFSQIEIQFPGSQTWAVAVPQANAVDGGHPGICSLAGEPGPVKDGDVRQLNYCSHKKWLSALLFELWGNSTFIRSPSITFFQTTENYPHLKEKIICGFSRKKETFDLKHFLER